MCGALYVYTEERRYERLWRQLDASSFLLFNVDFSGWKMMKYFSLRHRLHDFDEFEYELLLANIFHSIRKGVLLSFRNHI